MKTLLITIFVAPFLLMASDTESYLAEISQMKDFFTQEELNITLDYKVFTQKDNILMDSKIGLYEKSGLNYYYSIDGITIIQNDKWNVYVNNPESLIAIKEADKNIDASLLSFDEATKGCESISKIEEGDYYVYSLTFKKPVSEVYSDVKIYTKKSGLIPIKIIFDYSQVTSQTDKNGKLIKDKLRLEIYYSEIKTTVKRNFSTNDYFKLQNDKFETTAKYSTYTLIDQRIKNLK